MSALTVMPRDPEHPGQARVFFEPELRNGWDDARWDAEYVSFSGFFGAHGPDVFAAAPELLALVHQYRSDLRHPPAPDSIARRLEAIEAALAKVEGKPC